MYNLPRLNHEETVNLNRTVASNKFKSITKNLGTKKSLDQMASMMNSTKHLKMN